MKAFRLAVALAVLSASSQTVLARDLADFYYEQCLQNAAIIDAAPNADGSPHVPGGLFDASNPELYRFCTTYAIQHTEQAGRQ